jgi:hypothetical protein
VGETRYEEEVVKMSETLDGIPTYKVIGGLRYKYQSWHHTKEGAEEAGKRIQRASSKDLSFQILPHGRGKHREWRVYTRVMQPGQKASPPYRFTSQCNIVKKSEVVQVHRKGSTRGGRR